MLWFQSKHVSSLCREDGDATSDVRVGLMTYDSRIHLYDLSPALSRPHMLVITETDDLQLPVREGLLVSLKDCIDSINSCPGKLLIFHTCSIFQPSEPAISLAKECVSQGCGVHMFVLSQQDVGGAWPGHIPYLTGGALYTYSHLQGELDRERFRTDLKSIVDTDTGYKAELRIFVSKGERVFLFIILFQLNKLHTYIHCVHNITSLYTVLSYSTQTGDRRTRVHTLTLRCSHHLQDTFRQYQAQTLLTFYCKKRKDLVLDISAYKLCMHYTVKNKNVMLTNISIVISILICRQNSMNAWKLID
uniref:Si:dkey-13n15.2 n=1 Tax=Sander lucioperca TaxID=283035 RepID=A0A8D0AF55_SANLU